MYHRTKFSNLIVDIEVNDYKKDKHVARGIAINPVTGAKFDEIAPVRSKAVPKNRIYYAQREVLTKIEKQFSQLYGSKPANGELLETTFARLCDDVANGATVHYTWRSKNTNERALLYFKRNVLPLLVPFMDPSRIMLDTDRLTIADSLVSECIKNSGGKALNPKENAYNHLYNAGIIYNRLRELEPRLPELQLSPELFIERSPRPEQLKSLPRPMLTRFFLKLTELAENEPYKVFFAIACVMGCRPAEAAALKPNSIIWYGQNEQFCVAMINGQEQKGKIIHELKNEYSRRTIIIPYWGRALLSKCCEAIGENYPKDDQAMNVASNCAKWVKDLLIKCAGNDLKVKELDSLLDTISEDDKDDSNVIEGELKQDELKKIACYVLRRNFATITRNVMGLSLMETDRLLGHAALGDNAKALKSVIPDFNSYDTQKRIAQKMERFIFDPHYSLNPACTPYKASSRKVDLIEFSEVLVDNDTGVCTMHFNITAAEAGESIKITLPKDTILDLHSSSTPKSWQNHSRIVIGDTSLEPIKLGDEYP